MKALKSVFRLQPRDKTKFSGVHEREANKVQDEGRTIKQLFLNSMQTFEYAPWDKKAMSREGDG